MFLARQLEAARHSLELLQVLERRSVGARHQIHKFGLDHLFKNERLDILNHLGAPRIDALLTALSVADDVIRDNVDAVIVGVIDDDAPVLKLEAQHIREHAKHIELCAQCALQALALHPAFVVFLDDSKIKVDIDIVVAVRDSHCACHIHHV